MAKTKKFGFLLEKMGGCDLFVYFGIIWRAKTTTNRQNPLKKTKIIVDRQFWLCYIRVMSKITYTVTVTEFRFPEMPGPSKQRNLMIWAMLGNAHGKVCANTGKLFH